MDQHKPTYHDLEQRLEAAESLLEALRKGELDGGIGYDRQVVLIRLEAQEKELQTYRTHLEDMVKERTRELGVRNQELQAEIERRTHAEERLRHSLEEKKILLRELYHRTKNNMQVIRAILQLKASRCGDEKLDAFVREIGSKIQAMALVHQKLYQTQDLSRIHLHEYLEELADMLLSSYSGTPGKISLILDLAPVSATIDTAIPCGLLVSELMINAIKYAFPGENEGRVRITLLKTEDGNIQLEFADNGVGVPAGFDIHAQPTLGIQTIVALVEHQLKGGIRIDTRQGIAYTIWFPNNLSSLRV